MSYLHRHVDRRARCAVKLEGRTLTFQYRNDDGLVAHHQTLNFDAVQCRVDVDGLGVRWCVVMSGKAVLIREDTGQQVEIAPDGIGAGWAHVRGLKQGGCEVYLMDGLGGGGCNVYTEQGWFKRREPMAFSSEGIHHIEDDGTPVSEDTTRNLTAEQRAMVGQQMWCIDAHGGRMLGQIESFHMGFFRDGRMFELHPATPTQQSSFFGVSDNGEAWFAVPGENTPEPWEFTLQPHAKPQPAPTPAPPVPVPPQEPPAPIPAPAPTPEPPTTPTEPPAPPQVPQRPKWQRRLGSVLRWLEKAGL